MRKSTKTTKYIMSVRTKGDKFPTRPWDEIMEDGRNYPEPFDKRSAIVIAKQTVKDFNEGMHESRVRELVSVRREVTEVLWTEQKT